MRPMMHHISISRSEIENLDFEDDGESKNNSKPLIIIVCLVLLIAILAVIYIKFIK